MKASETETQAHKLQDILTGWTFVAVKKAEWYSYRIIEFLELVYLVGIMRSS